MLHTKKISNYFTFDTESWIVLYQQETSHLTRTFIYNTHLHPVFIKLAQVVAAQNRFEFKGWKRNEVIMDAVTHMSVKLELFDKRKGSAYSYFSVVARNYLLSVAQNTYALFKMQTSIESNSDAVRAVNQLSMDEWENGLMIDKTRDICEGIASFYKKNKAHVLHNTVSKQVERIYDEIVRSLGDQTMHGGSLHTSMKTLRSNLNCNDQKPVTRVLKKMRVKYPTYKLRVLNQLME